MQTSAWRITSPLLSASRAERCADEPRERDGWVRDLEVAALAEKALRELDERALAEVVGPRLERETEETDLSESHLDDGVERPLKMSLIRRQDALQDGQLEVGVARRVQEST